jgi:hypothetical protein
MLIESNETTFLAFFDPLKETYSELPFELGMLQQCVTMKGCKEWLVLLMNNGELRAWHRIDKYWDNDI